MTKLDWRAVELVPGVLREPTPDANRIILWLAGSVEQGHKHWERVANVPGAEIVEEKGLCFTQATSLPARQKLKGFFGKLLGGLKKPAGTSSWLLPSGGYAEQAGERQNGLLLVWFDDETGTPDEPRLKARYGNGHHLRKVGPNLFLVSPVQGGNVPATLLGNPREQAEKLLAAARQAGQRPAEATALTDLGLAFLRGGETNRALVVLEEAYSLAHKLGDRTRENDAQVNLAMALLAVGQPARAQELLGQTLAYSREISDRFLEIIILSNLGTVLAAMREYAEALTATDHALTLAREICDCPHEADLLWFKAILSADLGRHEQACQFAQAAIDIHATLRSPHVGWLTGHLKKYRPNTNPTGPGAVISSRHPGGYYTGPATVLATVPTGPGTSLDPALLRTAFSAIRELTSTSTSGMKTVPSATYQKRLEICATCPHHTGVRCKPCVAFTAAKAWFPHELCPIGKWEK